MMRAESMVHGAFGPNTVSWVATAVTRQRRQERKSREAGEARLGVGMLGPERLLADRQRALEERPRPGEIALGL